MGLGRTLALLVALASAALTVGCSAEASSGTSDTSEDGVAQAASARCV